VVDREALPLLKNNPCVDRLLPFDFASLLPLEAEAFDLVIGWKRNPGGGDRLQSESERKKRFCPRPEGNPFPLDSSGEYAFFLAFRMS